MLSAVAGDASHKTSALVHSESTERVSSHQTNDVRVHCTQGSYQEDKLDSEDELGCDRKQQNQAVSCLIEIDPGDNNGESTPSTETTLRERIEKIQSMLDIFLKHHTIKIRNLMFGFLMIGYIIYLGFAMSHNFQKSLPLLYTTAIVLCLVLCIKAKKTIVTTSCHKYITSISTFLINKIRKPTKCLFYLAAVVLFVYMLVMDTARSRQQLTSFGGLIGFISLIFITSKHPTQVRWRPVICGLVLQFVLGLLIMRWSVGFSFFKFLSSQVERFLSFTDVGSKFVFGEKGYMLHVVAFKILPVVIYFSSVISVLYHVGVMQIIIEKLAWLMHVTMETSTAESLSAAANIFIGQVETTVILKPFLPKLTSSELHCVMTGGFATVAGTVIAAYIEFGAPGEHVIAAALMSAPAALAVSKLGYPELHKSQSDTHEDVKLHKSGDHNLIDAASSGALTAMKLVAGVVVNLIAFISMLAFVNSVLSYLGDKVGCPQLNFQLICSYVFMPVAAMMGVEWQDTWKVASLLGTKIFLNEFIAFRDLGEMIQNGELKERSSVLATYSLCGFGSVAAVGLNLAAFVAMAPERKGELARRILRAMVAGNVACFMTACVAGIFLQDVGTAHFNHTSNLTQMYTTVPGNLTI